MDTVNLVQIPNEAVCITHSDNTIEKDINPTISPAVMGKIAGQTELFNLCMALDLREEKLWIQTF